MKLKLHRDWSKNYVMALLAATSLGGPICSKENPPTIAVMPGKGVDGVESISVTFRTPGVGKNKSDQVRYLKIDDPDGQTNLLLLAYLTQNQDPIPASLQGEIISTLLKRQKFWKDQKTKLPKGDVRLDLIDTTMFPTDEILKKTDLSAIKLTHEQIVIIVRDVLGPMTENDTVSKYAYSEFVGGKWVKQSPKSLSEIFPPEFYKTATSINNDGTFDKTTVAVDTCGAPEPINVETEKGAFPGKESVGPGAASSGKK